MRALLLVVAVGACGGDDAPAARPEVHVPLDAGIIDAAVMVIEDADVAPTAERVVPRERTSIAITLDSTPRGAVVLIDGVTIGNTPVYWEGEANGCVREFRFEMPGYTTARYRFVPVRDGLVHGKLDRVIVGDGGVPEVVEPEPMAPCPVRTATPRPTHRPAPRPAPPVVDAGPAAVDAAPGPAPSDAGP